MDRCALAYQYHQEGYSCAQSVAGAFADRTLLEPEELFAAVGGFGGGMGGTHEELCGAVSGGLLVLGLLYPHTKGTDREGKREIYRLAKEFRERFGKRFGHTRCGDLLRARPGTGEGTPAALRMGLKAHCDIMIVTAVEVLEALLEEQSGRVSAE